MQIAKKVIELILGTATASVLISGAQGATAASKAPVDQTWVCNFPGAKDFQTKTFMLHEKTLTEFAFNRSSSALMPAWSYNVVTDNPGAIVAVSGTGIAVVEKGLPGEGKPGIESDTIAIDRKTGSAVMGFISVYLPATDPVRGLCHQQK